MSFSTESIECVEYKANVDYLHILTIKIVKSKFKESKCVSALGIKSSNSLLYLLTTILIWNLIVL